MKAPLVVCAMENVAKGPEKKHTSKVGLWCNVHMIKDFDDIAGSCDS